MEIGCEPVIKIQEDLYMKKDIILKAFLILMLSAVLVMLFYAAVDLRAAQKLDLRTTCIAARDIPPRTRLKESDILEIEIPQNYLQDHTVNEKEAIIGKYTDIQGMIPAGSAFFSEMLKDEEDLPDNPTAQLKDGQSAYTLETDLARLGGTVIPGQRTDVYVTLTRRDGTTVSGALIENARVIAVKDHKGLDLDDPSSTGTPYLAILAVNREDLPYLSAAETAGEIRLFSGDNSYDDTKEAVRAADPTVREYLETLMNQNPDTMEM